MTPLVLALLINMSPVEETCELAGRLAARSFLAGRDEARRSELYQQVAPNKVSRELAETMIDVGRTAAQSRYAYAAGKSICMRIFRERGIAQ